MKTEVVYKDLEHKNVLVTGGGSGLGLAIARAFARNGSNVVIVGRNAGKLKRAKKELGENAKSMTFDLTHIDRMEDLVGQIATSTGEIDILINNAGINMKKDALAVSNQEFEALVRLNQTAVFALTREAARRMVARGSGNIIMISSMASHYGIPKVIGYSASKAAVESMTRAMAVEWSPHGVRVNCIAPGFIKTAMSSEALESDPERKKRVLNRTPMGKLGDPDDIANAALFLASAQSKYITGATLMVDGGNSIGF
jgi:NAD(P)-dependent dehydrogenase (short-subunit alcohol dehydrogenase family)